MLLCIFAGCSLEPRGADRERARLADASPPWSLPVEQRELPPLPEQPDWRDALERAFLANGELEAAYHEWAAAVARIRGESAYPNTNVSLGFEYMFSRERMKAWDRTTLSAGFDPSMMLQWPSKVAKAGAISLEGARARGMRFEAAKFTLQEKVLTAWLDYALMAERLRITRGHIEQIEMAVGTAAQRVRTGAPQAELLRAQTEWQMLANELANMESESASMRAMLNGMLALPGDAPLALREALPAPRGLPADDAALIALAVDRNPELAALAYEVAGRADALELARMAYIPDISPQVAFTGGISQMIGAMVTMPTTIPKIRASIEEARAMLRAGEAMARQTRFDRAARFVAVLYALRNEERQAAFLRDEILARAEQMLLNELKAYAGGNGEFEQLIEMQRTLLDLRLLIAESRIAREKRLAELETLMGVDVETLEVMTTNEVHHDN